MRVQHLTSVDGEFVHDLAPEVVGQIAATVRLDDDVRRDDVALLARASTYRHATFGLRVGGAAIGVRPRLVDGRSETVDRLRAEVAPLLTDGAVQLLADFGMEGVDPSEWQPGARDGRQVVGPDGARVHDRALGRGVASAAAAWLGSLDGRSVAIEGFGVAGAGVARAFVARGARVVAVSTHFGAVADGAGLDVDALVGARHRHGPAFVRTLGLVVHRPEELHELPVDVLVPGAGTGMYDAAMARRVDAAVIAPVAAVPYTADGLDELRTAGVAALPDFVTNAGDVLARNAPPGLPADEVIARAERLIGEQIEAARLSKIDPFDYAALVADTFLTTWIPEPHRPDGPALASDTASVPPTPR